MHALVHLETIFVVRKSANKQSEGRRYTGLWPNTFRPWRRSPHVVGALQRSERDKNLYGRC